MSFPRYQKFKDSGVEWLGQVPEHWEVMQSRRMFRVRNEDSRESDGQLTASQKYGILLQSDFIEAEGRRVVETIKGVDTLKHVEPNDFIISLRTFQGGIEWSKVSGCITWHYVVLVPIKHVHPPFFAHLLKSTNYIQALRTTTNLIRDGQDMRYSHFVQVPLPVVPLAEQTAIAAFLDRETGKIDALVAEQRRLMELLKEKRQAVISHAVTRGLNPAAPLKPSGIEWLGEVPAHWEVGPLKRYWCVTDCKHVTAEFVEDGIPLASIREVQSRWVALENAKCTTEHFYEALTEGGRLPQPGDLIFSRNATVGEVAQVPALHPRFAMGQDVVLLRKLSNDYASDFLQHVIRSPVILRQLDSMMIGSTFKRINVEEIRSFWLPWPPTDEQAAISTYLESELAKFDALTVEAQRAIDLLQERRTALISAAVTGQIDVRNS